MSSIKDTRVSDLLHANKLLFIRVKSDQVSIKLFDIGNTDKMKLIAYHDASYANLQHGGSQGCFIIFVTDQNKCKASPIAWQSRKLKHVVKITLAAEILFQVEASEACFWLGSCRKFRSILRLHTSSVIFYALFVFHPQLTPTPKQQHPILLHGLT